MMRRTRTTLVIIAGLLALAVILLLAGCAAIPTQLPPVATAGRVTLPTQPPPAELGKPVAPLDVDLSLSGKPLLGSTQTMTFTVKPWPGTDAPNAAITITLPPEIELVSGSLTWQGDIPKDETRQVQVNVRIASKGYYSARGYVRFSRSVYGGYGKTAALYFVVDDTDAWAGKQPPKNNWVANNVSPGGRPVPPGTERITAHAYLTRPLEWDQETDLIYEITPTADIDQVEIGLILPQAGIAVVEQKNPRQKTLVFRPAAEREILGTKVGPSMSWYGPLVKDDRTVIRVRLKPATTGEGAIIAYVSE
ncbi:MAG: hypothetical protein CVU38_21240, partial [Chloroflexi bacterium HGW-Chloroflexi-1]